MHVYAYILNVPALNPQEAKQTLDDLKVTLDKVTHKMNAVAEFFCQDVKKFKLEELFADLLNFLRELQKAQEVNLVSSISPWGQVN